MKKKDIWNFPAVDYIPNGLLYLYIIIPVYFPTVHHILPPPILSAFPIHGTPCRGAARVPRGPAPRRGPWGGRGRASASDRAQRIGAKMLWSVVNGVSNHEWPSSVLNPCSAWTGWNEGIMAIGLEAFPNKKMYNVFPQNNQHENIPEHWVNMATTSWIFHAGRKTNQHIP